MVQVMSPIPSVCLSVCLSVFLVYCGETSDLIWMLFGLIGRLGPRMRQVDGDGNHRMRRGNMGHPFVISEDFVE